MTMRPESSARPATARPAGAAPLRSPENAPRHDPADERALVGRVRTGDEAAFEAIFRAHYPLLLTFADGYVRSEPVAEELVQDVFLQIWTNRASWTVETSLRAYLYAAVRNRCLNHLEHQRVDRRWRLRAETEQTGPSLSGRVPSTDEATISGEIRRAVRAAIDALPERARMVAILRWHRGLSYAEIAEAMGISPKGVENQLGRVTKLLRQRLEAYRPEGP